MAVMTNKKLVEKCIDIAKNYKTIYVMGCFGAPISGGNVTRYCNNHEYNRRRERTSLIKAVANKGYFGFDCVNLIKGILWGWKGDSSQTYGGAKYNTNGVPDTNADGMIKLCKDVSTDFSKIEVGEAVWLKGHIGVYIGNGLAVECTPSWENDVQITAVGNIGKKSGYNTRTWTKHGKIPYVSYEKGAETPAKPATPTQTVANAEYYPKYTGNSNSIVDALKSLKIDSSLAHRKEIAKANGIDNYSGKAGENGTLLNLLKQGKLKKPTQEATGSAETTPKIEYYPKYTGESNSLVDALKSLKIDSAYQHRKQIAIANGITSYSGKAAQNTKLLELLKQGKLIKE